MRQKTKKELREIKQISLDIVIFLVILVFILGFGLGFIVN